jgi:hypothetical protein
LNATQSNVKTFTSSITAQGLVLIQPSVTLSSSTYLFAVSSSLASGTTIFAVSQGGGIQYVANSTHSTGGGSIAFTTATTPGGAGLNAPLYVSASGNVGINTNAPGTTYALNVNGQVYAGAGTYSNGTTYVNGQLQLFSGNSFNAGNGTQYGQFLLGGTAAYGVTINRNNQDAVPVFVTQNLSTAATGAIQVWESGGVGIATMTRYGLAIGTETAAVLASSATFVITTAQDVVVVSSNGMVGFSGPAPTYSGCGTVTVLSSSVTAQSGAISMGGSPGNTCTVTFPKPFIGVPACIVSLGGSLGTGVFGSQGATTAASVIGTCDNATGLASCGAGTTMTWHCFGN